LNGASAKRVRPTHNFTREGVGKLWSLSKTDVTTIEE